MKSKHIAFISDIHGNSEALRVVLQDIQSRGIESIINLGDSLYGPLDPKGTFDLLQDYQVQSVSGNQDRFILENLDHTTDIPTLEFTKSQMNTVMTEWLRSLPFSLILNQIYCCHASPNSDCNYLLEKLDKNVVSVKNVNELDEILKDIPQQIVFCAHSHVSKVVKTKYKTIINCGSVGLPAYDDELPIYHKMESMNPMAKYAIINLEEETCRVEQISLSYPYEEAALLAEKNYRPDWAEWIRNGRV